jgi:hypothetical protein
VLYLLNATRLASIYNTQQSAVKERNVHGYSYYIPQLCPQKKVADIEHIVSKSNLTDTSILNPTRTQSNFSALLLLCHKQNNYGKRILSRRTKPKWQPRNNRAVASRGRDTVPGNDPIEMKYSQSVKDSHAVRGVFHLDFIACPHLSFGPRFSRSPALSPHSRRESNRNKN